MKICVIDNDESFLRNLEGVLARRKDEKLFFDSPDAALSAVKREEPDGLIWSISLFRDEDLESLKQIRLANPGLFVAMSGEIGGNPIAGRLLRDGECEFIRKPATTEEVERLFRRLDSPDRHAHNEESHPSLSRKYRYFDLIGESAEMTRLYESIEVVSRNQGTVLIRGELGTCREKVAKAIHQLGDRRKGPLVKFPCAIIPKEIFDLELFGGGPDSHGPRRGALESAEGGTLFLDEVEHLPLEAQIRLVEFFQSRTASQAGNGDPEKTAPRIIASCGSDLMELTRQRRFRHELFYRLNILPIEVPPLRLRKNDIPMLVEHYLTRYSPSVRFKAHPEALNALVEFSWPGNIRQLENLIERLVLTVPGNTIFRHLLPDEINQERIARLDFDSSRSLEEILDEVKCLMIRKALVCANGNRKLAAHNLKVPYSTFRVAIRKLNLA